MARVAQATFVVIGLTFLVGYGIGWLSGYEGPVWSVAALALYLVAGFALPFMAVASVVWLVIDSARKFRRCRATRTA